jgi:hypothetical protein
VRGEAGYAAAPVAQEAVLLAPEARGPVSALVRSWLVGAADPDVRAVRGLGVETCVDPVRDEDIQCALWMLYELHYRGFTDVDDSWEWAPECLHLRQLLETRFEAALRELAGPVATRLADRRGDFAQGFFDVVASVESVPLAAFLERRAGREQMLEFLVHRTVYHLKEADPHAWAIPRLGGRAEVALLEVLHDEYGAGRPERLHAQMFRDTLVACGLQDEYGAYFEQVPAVVLAVNNAMSLFGLHRRLRGAAMGHLAAFETTSSVPARRVARGLRRLGFPDRAAAYFDEHVVADAVHEQVAVRSICGSLVSEEPGLFDDVTFGAAACLVLDDLAAEHLLERWRREESGLRTPTALAAGW